MDQEDQKPLVGGVKRQVSYSEQPPPTSPDVLDPDTVPGYPKIIVPKRKIIVEPVLFMYSLAMMGSVPVIEQYLYARFQEGYPVLINGTQHENTTAGKGCQNVNYSDPIFIATQSVQSKTSQFQMYLQVTSSLINAITTLVYGAYSDSYGRRVVLVFPAVAMFLKLTLNCFVVGFKLPVEILIVSQVLDGLGGGFATILMGVYAYIADITTPEQRGMRIALAETALTMAIAISQVSLGYFIRATGFLWPLLSLSVILLLNIAYILLFVPETVVKKTGRKFSVTGSFKETYKAYAQKVNNRHVKVFILVFATMLFMFPQNSKYTIQILLTMNIPLCWGSVEIGIFLAVSALVIQFGGLIGIKLFKMCHMPETWIAVLGCISWMTSNLVNAWADTTVMMYVVCFTAILMMAGIPMYRTILSRLVEKDEQGKIFSGVACVEAIANLASAVAMNQIYRRTLFFMRGFVFLVAAMFGFAAMIVTFIYMCVAKASDKRGRRGDVFERSVN